MGEVSRYIPSKVRLEVRKRCHFGCVVCGMPIYEYEHIDEYAANKEHDVNNLVLLCPNHHTSKTNKQNLSKERIRYYQQNPFNANREFTSPYKVEPTTRINCEVGGNKVLRMAFDNMNEHHVIWVNGVHFFKVHRSGGWLTFSIILTDSDGNMLLKVEEGEIIANTKQWDFQYVGNYLTVRRGHGDVLLRLKLSDREIKVERGSFFTPDKSGFEVHRQSLYGYSDGDMEAEFDGVVYSDCVAGFIISNPKFCFPAHYPTPAGYVNANHY